MIIKEYHLEKTINEHKNFIGLLIYGPNEGLVKEQIEKITKDSAAINNSELINFNGKDLDSDPSSLDDVVKTVSMFHKNKIITADNIKDKHLKIIEIYVFRQ